MRKLVEQLGSGDFKTRDKAGKELAKLEEVPDALREIARSGDLETKRRAEAVVEVIEAGYYERILQATVTDLNKIELDRFVRRMVIDEKFVGAKPWEIVQTLTRAATQKANALGGRKYGVPDFDMNKLALYKAKAGAKEKIAFKGTRILVNDPAMRLDVVRDSVVLCMGPTPRFSLLTNSVLIVDGDFTTTSATVANSLVIVRGKIGRCTAFRDSIILATEECEGATLCQDSFLQVKNDKIRLGGSRDCVLIKTVPLAFEPMSDRVLDTDQGPLQMLKFSAEKIVPDDQLVWGKSVDGLAVAIAPAKRPDNYLLRWKNLGRETLELHAVRFNTDINGRNDDLWNHVLVKGPDGKHLPARKLRFPSGGGPRFRGDTVILAPGKTYEETIDLATYVDRPAAKGRYKLSIELDLPDAQTPSQMATTFWTGKIQSNELDITFGK